MSKFAAVAALALMMVPATTSAQATCGNTGAAGVNCSLAGVSVSATVQHIVFMEIDDNTATLTAPTDLDFTTGATVDITDLAAQTLTIRSNADWAVTLTGAAWTAPWAKPIGDLEYTINGGTNWTTVTNGAQAAGSGTKTGSGSVVIGYRTGWDVGNDEPGAYTMGITLTITGN